MSDPNFKEGQSSKLLEEAYNVANFRMLGHELVDMLADHVERVQTDPDFHVLPWRSPQEELEYWQEHFKQPPNPKQFFNDLLERSIRIHHAHYIGHQVSVPALIAALAGLFTDALSNGTGVYEMGMASNAIEKVVADYVAHRIGFDEKAEGFLTSGGSLANLTAILAARKQNAPTDVWETGHQQALAIMVSEEAHYCIDRVARILGMGAEGIIKVPADSQYKIRTELLEEYYLQAEKKGQKVIAVVGCACSTSTGSYDDLEAIASFCEEKDLWFHVDGAHGGAVIFSETYQYLVKGIERADSVVIDFHKMLMTPSLNTALIFKDGTHGYQTFQQKAQYLWESQQSREWYHSGKRTFECTKLMLSSKVYVILNTYGPEIFEANVNQLYNAGKQLAHLIEAHPSFELALKPEANIVNFRYTDIPEQDQDRVNAAIRKTLVEEGKFYIVQTTLRKEHFLRATVMNPATTEKDFIKLLDELERIGQQLTS